METEAYLTMEGSYAVLEVYRHRWVQWLPQTDYVLGVDRVERAPLAAICHEKKKRNNKRREYVGRLF